MTNPSDMSNTVLADTLEKECRRLEQNPRSLCSPSYYASEAASRLRAMEWQPIDERALSGERVALLWKANNAFEAHFELGWYRPATQVFVNTYGHPFTREPDGYFAFPPAPKGE